MSASDLVPFVIGAASLVGLAVASSSKKSTEKFNNSYVGKNMNSYAPKALKSQSSDKKQIKGDQELAYQMYQQSIIAATPTMQQLNAISGQTGITDVSGPESVYASANGMNTPMYSSDYQAVDFGTDRALSISSCAQNAGNFLSSSLLPKPEVSGDPSWDVNAPNDVLASQNFLSAAQQIGVDTVMSSLRNQSYDLRDTIPNPIGSTGLWMQSTILPDFERKPLSCFIDTGKGPYGCGPAGANQEGTYINK